MSRRRYLMLAAGPAASLALAALYFSRAADHGRLLNTNAQAYDQSAYIHFAEKMRDSGYRYWTDGARAPAYPFLQSLFYDQRAPEAAFFEAGKQRSIALSIVGLAILAWLLWSGLSPLSALNVWLVAAFTVFLFRSAYFQPELAYSVTFFAAFVLALRYLASPSVRRAVGCGAVLGVAHLFKPSALPALLLVATVALLAQLTGAITRKAPARVSGSAAGRRRWLAPLALVAAFAVVASPYLVANQRVFGRWTYNVNTNFYMWYDSWEQAKAGTRAHGDRRGWPQMPAGELPGPRRYLREHTAHQIVDRLTSGLVLIARTSAHSTGYAKYAAAYGLLALASIAARRRRALAMARRRAPPVLFAVLCLGAYTVLYAWFGPINYGERFVLSLLLPWLYVMAAISAALPLPWRGRWLRRQWPANVWIEIAILAVLVADIAQILAWRIVSVPAGT